MSARILLLAAEDFTDHEMLEAVLDKTRLAVSANELPPLFLKTMDRTDAERHARRWWLSNHLPIGNTLIHPNPYVVINSLTSEYPEAVLLFGSDKYIEDAATKAARLGLHVVRVAEPVTAGAE